MEIQVDFTEATIDGETNGAKNDSTKAKWVKHCEDPSHHHNGVEDEWRERVWKKLLITEEKSDDPEVPRDFACTSSILQSNESLHAY